jgi:UDPglucose 6-dehydrogenase
VNITVIGTGYVGLVSGTCFSDIGNNVTCLDIDEARITSLKGSEVPFYEPGLGELIKKNLSKGNLHFSSSYEESLSSCDVIFICVGTPENADGSSNLSYIEKAVDSIAEVLYSQEKTLISFIKSTVPPGTCAKLQSMFDERLKNSKSEVLVASNPEFLKEGAAIEDFMRPDRIIVGSDSNSVEEIAKILYRPINWKSDRLKIVSIESAELIKYSSNAFLATKISFINEISRLCDSINADVSEIRLGMGLDNRINPNFLYPGVGFGGSCFPKDIKSLQNSFQTNNLKSPLIDSVLEVNNTQRDFFLNKFYNYYKDKNLKDISVALWGLSFKPETDDIRESISIKIIKELAPQVEHIHTYDPIAQENSKTELLAHKNISYHKSPKECLVNSNCLMLITEWKEFWITDPDFFSSLSDKVIFDGRNVLDKKNLEDHDYHYFGIGK